MTDWCQLVIGINQSDSITAITRLDTIDVKITNLNMYSISIKSFAFQNTRDLNFVL